MLTDLLALEVAREAAEPDPLFLTRPFASGPARQMRLALRRAQQALAACCSSLVLRCLQAPACASVK